MPEDAAINASVSGGAAGIVGAAYVHIENLTQYAAPLASEAKKPTGPIPPSPYKGLAYFGPQDAGHFFGRERAIQALVAGVAKRSFTALVGASGSGKSSVVLAGLAPRLETQGGWRSTYFRIGTEPDKNPFAALARALSPMLGDGDVIEQMTRAQKLADSLASGDISLVYVIGQCRAVNPAKRILFIADQFEEVFTLVPDDELRERFINALITAFPDPVQGTAPDVCLVLTLRADFYNAALRYRPLADRLQDHIENLGPMTRDELREATVKPADAVHIGFERGLVDTILDDVEKHPGSLPLLQFALREMWGRLEKPLMTRADYDAIGGVEGALAKRAQAIFEAVTRNETDAASVALFRRLFTRLVALGEGAEDTRRIVGREELGPDAWALAQRLANEDNRLIVTAATTRGKVRQETAEVVHEALIRNWPTLVDWIKQDRDLITWRNQLKPSIIEWRADPLDEANFIRGRLLDISTAWFKGRVEDLSEDERDFIAASLRISRGQQRRSFFLFLITAVGGSLLFIYSIIRLPELLAIIAPSITQDDTIFGPSIPSLGVTFGMFWFYTAYTRQISFSILLIQSLMVCTSLLIFVYQGSPLDIPGVNKTNTTSPMMALFAIVLLALCVMFYNLFAMYSHEQKMKNRSDATRPIQTIFACSLLVGLLSLYLSALKFENYHAGLHLENIHEYAGMYLYPSIIVIYTSFGSIVGLSSAQFRIRSRINY